MSIKKELLLVAGYTQEDMAKADLAKLGSEEVQRMVRDSSSERLLLTGESRRSSRRMRSTSTSQKAGVEG